MPKRNPDEAPEPDEMERAPAEASALRPGFTTGTAATAAAVAASQLLAGRPAPEKVELRLPDGEKLSVAVLAGSLISRDEALALVVKDAGDDPDVTNHAEIGAIVRRRSEPGLIKIIGGRGVGQVTRPGLAAEVGGWAINPVPQRMLKENLKPFLSPDSCPGLEVEIFVEKGLELAPKTLNPRLGIVGGISILGTSGLVKPFSHEAYSATIESALKVAAADGQREIVLTTGRHSEKLAQAQRPDLSPLAFVQMADFYGEGLKMAADLGFGSIGVAAFFGKAVKQAAGHFNTHAHRGDQDLKALAQWLEPLLPQDLVEETAQALTARAALELLIAKSSPETPALAAQLVIQRALAVARGFCGPEPSLWMMVFDYEEKLLAQGRLPKP